MLDAEQKHKNEHAQKNYKIINCIRCINNKPETQRERTIQNP